MVGRSRHPRSRPAPPAPPGERLLARRLVRRVQGRHLRPRHRPAARDPRASSSARLPSTCSLVFLAPLPHRRRRQPLRNCSSSRSSPSTPTTSAAGSVCCSRSSPGCSTAAAAALAPARGRLDRGDRSSWLLIGPARVRPRARRRPRAPRAQRGGAAQRGGHRARSRGCRPPRRSWSRPSAWPRWDGSRSRSRTRCATPSPPSS